jgi:hypothetical protein
MYGCDRFGYNDSMASLCVKPLASPVAAPAYYIGFIILGTMIILNLFIGVIMKGMDEMEDEMAHKNGKQTQAEYQQEKESYEQPSTIKQFLKDTTWKLEDVDGVSGLLEGELALPVRPGDKAHLHQALLREGLNEHREGQTARGLDFGL